MGLGSGSIGLKGVHSVPKRYKTEEVTVDGVTYKIKSSVRTWHCNFAGYDIWVNGEKIFKNYLSRDEAIQSAIKRYITNHLTSVCA